MAERALKSVRGAQHHEGEMTIVFRFDVFRHRLFDAID